jgi:pSer/pThr/pTyr-binding forkhead associated (FHA) protein
MQKHIHITKCANNCGAQLEIDLRYVNPNKEKILEQCPSCKKSQLIINPLFGKKTEPQVSTDDDDKTQIGGGGTAPKADVTEIVAVVTYTVFKIVQVQGGQEVYLQKGTNLIGNKAPVSLAFTNDAYISGQHCCIEIREGKAGMEAVLYDNGTGSSKNKPSTNGTYVNESTTRLESFEKIILKNGDRIRVGRTMFVFRMS